jgi:predicted PhzF superfamily epimerase YddE/YHI9
MALKIFQVDSFTDRPYAGNPAAVCVLAQPADPVWMQQVAREMNLSETAFLWPQADGYHLRWFTPTVEVDLCGHATLASAYVLWSEGHLSSEKQARFYTLSGLLTAERRGTWIDLDFPAEPEHKVPVPPPELASALLAPVLYVGKNRMDYLVEVDCEATLKSLQPNFDLLGRIPARGIIVTAKASTPGYDFTSRFFAPRSGVAEDPVTGSAHCCLGPYWQQRLGKNEMLALQVSDRGGVVQVSVQGNRVRLSGQAVLVLRGELLAGP